MEKNPRLCRWHKILQQSEQSKRISSRNCKIQSDHVEILNGNDSRKIKYKWISSIHVTMRVYPKNGMSKICDDIEEKIIMTTNNNSINETLARLQNNLKKHTNMFVSPHHSKETLMNPW